MKSLITRLRHFSRFTVASLSLLVLALSIARAEGWGALGRPPTAARVDVTSAYVLYSDVSVLTPDGTYTTGGVSYSVPAATYDVFGDLCYSEGTILYPDGSWAYFPVPTD
jgi:hypothetical protein